ncbi:MAG: hypothetical protein EXS05_09520 [Planctomycetaceae bacterium]|nr:hypothetical protein [Planctomycetaceae bacterium]
MQRSKSVHVLVVAVALLVGGVLSIFGVEPLVNFEHSWHRPIHEYLNSMISVEWRWLAKNVILVVVIAAVVGLVTWAARIFVPNSQTGDAREHQPRLP